MGLLGSRQNTVERINSVRLNSAILGIVRPIFFGQARISGRLIWYGDFTINKAKQQGGKGLAKGGAAYVYTASIIAALCEGPCSALLNVWDSTGRFVLISNSPNGGGGGTGGTGGGGGGGIGGPPNRGAPESFTIPGGGGTYTVVNAAVFGFDQGVARQDSFSVVANDYGSPGSVTLTGTQNTPMVQVPSAPGAGQYSVNPATGVYTFSAADAGKTVQINYSYYRYQIITQEKTVVPFSGPFTVTVDNSTNFKYDLGVVYYPSGTALVDVTPSAPTVGEYSRSGATYTFNSGDSGNGILINYVYQDPNTDTNAPATLNITLVGGTQGQAAESYMTSKHPGQALGYSQLAYIFSSGMYLGFSPELPNYTYEVSGPFQFGGGILDANPADCIVGLLTNQQYGLGFPPTSLGSLTLARQCWSANSFFISPLIENARSASSTVAEWLEAGMVGAFWSEALLKFVPYGDTTAVNNGVTFSPSTTPVANLTYDNFIIDKKADEPITIERAPWQDAWNKVRVSYNARINDYNPEVIEESDEAGIQRFGLRVEDAKTWDFVTTVAAAQYSASMRVQRSAYIRNRYTFRLPSSFAWLEPMDVVTIPFVDLSNTVPVRINKIEDDPAKGLTITAEDFIWGTAQPAYNPKAVNTPYLADLGQQDPGNTNALIIELPNRAPGNNFNGCTLVGYVNGSNPNWGGCHVWVSFDGTHYDILKDSTGNPLNVGQGRLGNLTQSLASFGGSNPDTTDTLQVKLNVAGDVLPSTSSASAAQLVSLCAIVNGSNQLELLSYQNSSLVGSELFNLTTLYRGVFGTSAISHSPGEIFARIDEASFQDQFDPSFIGQTIHFKFTSFNLLGNQEQSLANVSAFSVAITGVGKGAVALDTGYLLVGAPGYTAYRPLSNPLTGHDAGSSATVNIASFVMQLAGLTNINYNSGAITGLSYGTLYYIYFDDPAEVGGTVTYNATTTKETAFAGTNRFFVGSIFTPVATGPDTTGNADGGSGAQYGMKSILSMSVVGTPALSGNGSITSPNNMVDGDPTTKATFSVTGNGALNSAGIQLSGPPGYRRAYKSATLFVRWDMTVNSAPASASDGFFAAEDVFGVQQQIVFQLFRGAGTQAVTTSSVSLPLGLNLSQVQVFVQMALSAIVASGTCTGAIYEAWIEAIE